ncbi:MAG: RNA polymerase-binding protein DksA [Methylococcaceae bacterium]|jgi:DnaK suppressor protein|nr:RNA polymerase-binding protein DksA [Methylococcaceae bacterium]
MSTATVSENRPDLTEADLLEMPESEYMNSCQLAFFKSRLLAMRKDVMQSAQTLVTDLREAEHVADPSDRATLEEEYLRTLRVRDRERKLLERIERALGRIETGGYGFCEDSGEPIGLGRLLARPTARLSLDAQKSREHYKSLYED